MIENMNMLIDDLKTSEIGKATRKSALVILKANLNAWNTTRTEIGKVANLVVKEGEKLTRRSRSRTEQAIESLSDAANERAMRAEKRMQTGVNKVIHNIGLPTAGEVDKLSKKIAQLSKKVEAKTAKRTVRRTPARKALRKTTRRAA